MFLIKGIIGRGLKYKREKGEFKMKSMKIFIDTLDKKDYKYWIFILTFLLILSWTVRVNSTTELLDKISFAVGLSSLLLSVIAIFYSIVKGEQTSQQAIMVQENLRKISASVEDIQTIKKELQETRSSMDKSFTNLEALYKVEDLQQSNEKTSELMGALKSAVFSESVKEKGEKEKKTYFDARFKLIDDDISESIIRKMFEPSAKELGIRLMVLHKGSQNVVYAAFEGPSNFDFEGKFMNSDLQMILELIKVDKIPIHY